MKNRFVKKFFPLIYIMAIGLTASGCKPVSQNTDIPEVEAVQADAFVLADEVNTGMLKMGLSCHDPQIIVGQDGQYYMCGSHMVMAKSTDLSNWEYTANGNRMFDNIYDGDLPAFAYVGKNTDGGYSVWASNIFYNQTMDKYIMYFCTTSSYIKSNLCMAVSDSPQGPFSYVDTILYSGFSKDEIAQTNLYEVLGEEADIERYLQYGGFNNKEWPNCIDPAVFTDADGRIWMTYGSWSGGIFLLELNPETGYPIFPEGDEEKGIDPYYGVHLVGGGHHAVEGPYIEYCEENGYYYLFLSYGGLEREGGYQIRQFRSENVTGPYVDAAGNVLGDDDMYFSYGLKMMGNYQFPSMETAYMAPGGQSTFKSGDKYYITYHQRFDSGSEYHEPRVHKMFLNRDGWFVTTPFQTAGETLRGEGYLQSDIEGTFYLLNHKVDVSNKIYEGEEYHFEAGVITGGEWSGSYEVEEGSNYVKIVLDDKVYEGVIVDMQDEAGNPVRCIMASGAQNMTVWAVQYMSE